jgi:enterochelin esterase-like enzyme
MLKMKCLVVLSLLLPFCAPARATDDYKLGPDSEQHDGVPHGRLESFVWTSEVFKGTVRDCWVYIPSQYDGTHPAAVMVFQDGGGYQDVKGSWRVPIVFDNLINKKEMPVTIGIFINPGNDPVKNPPVKPGDVKPETKPGEKPKKRPGASNRSFEYDTLSDQYSRFLLEEILPEVSKRYNLKLTNDPEGRAIAGLSSGAICAFTVAWQHPESFRKVVSSIGSFTNIRGGGAYPDLIRQAEKKPIRVALQDGSNDLQNSFGKWFEANQAMAAVFKEKGYDYQFIAGDGGHTAKHGGSIFPDTMRWIWRDYTPKQ